MQIVRLKVDGMTCDHCKAAVETALTGHDGVRAATVHLEQGAAEVQYDETRVTPQEMIASVDAEGYQASLV